MIIKTNLRTNLISLVKYLWRESVFAIAFSMLVYYLYEEKDLRFLASFSFVPVSFFGTILSVFLAFRNNNAYSRWWEARQIWGDLVNVSRMFATQAMTYLSPGMTDDIPHLRNKISNLQRELVMRHIASINLMRMQLRQSIHYAEVDDYLNKEDQALIRSKQNPACALFAVQAARLRQACSEGLLTDYRFIDIMHSVERFYDIIGACERIKSTPFPREYDGFVRYLIWILIAIMPLYLLAIFSDDLSKLLIIPGTLGITLIIGFANKAGEMLEDPFENRIHDIPMTTLCDKIEADLRSQLGELQSARENNHPPDQDSLVIW